ncbi:hypothetical protein [Shinella pollutisoli]|uniref:Uncharacterized protein n=1 Tax=Shinella pollutisoli TaxID=2250594 RepID=A0ABV7DJW4_9HYPH|nr:hypothetical protein [Shinella pollutisoli]
MEKIFTLPSAIRAEAARMICAWSNPLMFSLAEQLEAIGVQKVLACQVEIGAFMTCAARVGMLSACSLEGRSPKREWWIEATAEDFDRAVDWFVGKFPDQANKLGLRARNAAIDARFVL